MLNFRIVTLSVVLVFAFVLGTSPALAATTTQSSNAPQACTNGAASQALGVEDGLLSLLTERVSSDPNPVAEIIRSGDYAVHIDNSSQATHIAYERNIC